MNSIKLRLLLCLLMTDNQYYKDKLRILLSLLHIDIHFKHFNKTYNMITTFLVMISKGVPIPVSVSVSEPIPVVSVSDRYRCL